MRMSNSMDPHQARLNVGPDLSTDCAKFNGRQHQQVKTWMKVQNFQNPEFLKL